MCSELLYDIGTEARERRLDALAASRCVRDTPDRLQTVRAGSVFVFRRKGSNDCPLELQISASRCKRARSAAERVWAVRALYCPYSAVRLKIK